jgi:hypothetical protein
MVILDFVYYISLKAFLRGNKDSFGGFLMSSLWISLFQYILLYLVLGLIEYTFQHQFTFVGKGFKEFAITIIVIVILNNIYLNTNNRNEKILSRFVISEKHSMIFGVLLVCLFFIILWLGIFVNKLNIGIEQ